MKKISIILISITFFSVSCTKDKGNGMIVSTNMDISYLDKSGNDLLDPNTTGYYSPSNMHVFKIVDGVKKEINNPMMQFPKDFLIYKNDSLKRYFLRIFLDNPTYLQLNQNTTDTMTCEIDNSNGNKILKKFSDNGKLYWDNNLKPQRITIIK